MFNTREKRGQSCCSLVLNIQYYILAIRMAAVHGFLAASDSTMKEWTEYIEQPKFSFAANGITDAAKQPAVLLSCCDLQRFGY